MSIVGTIAEWSRIRLYAQTVTRRTVLQGEYCIYTLISLMEGHLALVSVVLSNKIYIISYEKC